MHNSLGSYELTTVRQCETEFSRYTTIGVLKKEKKFPEIIKKQRNYSRCHGVVLYNEVR